MSVTTDNVCMPFTFQATRDLWQYLGDFDALSEINELAVRDFLSRYERVQMLNGTECGLRFVAAKSAKYGICVNASTLARLAVGMAQTYVCTVWNCADGFLRELRKEHQTLTTSTWAGDAKDKPRLRFTLENLFGTEEKGAAAIGPHRYALMEYCRLVRNRLAHPRSTSDVSVAEAYQRVYPYTAQINAEYRLTNAPQPMARMKFEDAVLLSRVTKDVALALNEKARPDDSHLLQAMDPKAFRHMNNLARRRRAMIGFLCTRFGIDTIEAGIIVDAAH